MARRSRLVALSLSLALSVSGCTVPSLADIPLPGGAPQGPGYRIVVEFADVLDLVPQAAVKVNDVTVGSVERISLSGWTARVQLRIDEQVQLPANATAAVRQTSLLGEKYVAVDAPVTEAPVGRLSAGDVIPLARTRQATEVEEVLAALGLLLNGGGLAQLKTINQELAAALGGREEAARDMLHQLDTFIGGLDAQRADLIRAVTALDRLTGRLNAQRAVLGDAVDALGPGLTVLAQQRTQLTEAVTALGELGKVGTDVVNRSRDDTLASLRALQPILEQLVQAGDALPKSLNFLLSFPFPPNVSGAIVGDFVNLSLTADLDAATILGNLLSAGPTLEPTQVPDKPGSSPAGPDNKRPGSGKPQPGDDPPLLDVLPQLCLPLDGLLPPGWLPPSECDFPEGCQVLAPGSAIPVGGLLISTGLIPPGTIFPANTRVQPGSVLTLDCLLPVTGAVDGLVGGLSDLLGGGLLR